MLLRVLKAIALAFAGYFVFGSLGELSATGVLDLASGSEAVGWIMYGVGVLGALAAPFVVAVWRKGGRRISPFTRLCLVGFTAFFCWQWTVAGVPDWSPLPLALGAAVCLGAAVAVLRLTASASWPVLSHGGGSSRTSGSS